MRPVVRVLPDPPRFPVTALRRRSWADAHIAPPRLATENRGYVQESVGKLSLNDLRTTTLKCPGAVAGHVL